MRRRNQRWVLPLAAVGGITLVILLLWLAARAWPFFTDWVLYPDVDSQCAGVIATTGPQDGDAARHCYLGPTTHQNEQGFHQAIEIASGGWLMTYGHGTLQNSGDKNALHTALFRPPGDDKPWFCANSGTLWPGDTNRFELTQASEIIPENTKDKLSLELKMTASGKIVSGSLGDRNIGSGRLWGTSCLQDERRCTFRVGHENSIVSISLRTWIGMRTADHREIPIEEAIVLLQEGRSPHRVEIAVAGASKGSTVAWASDSDLLTIKINGLTEPAACPTAKPGDAVINGEFAP